MTGNRKNTNVRKCPVFLPRDKLLFQARNQKKKNGSLPKCTHLSQQCHHRVDSTHSKSKNVATCVSFMSNISRVLFFQVCLMISLAHWDPTRELSFFIPTNEIAREKNVFVCIHKIRMARWL